MPDNPPFTPPPSAAVQDLTTPPAPIDLAKLQANDAIELARLEQMSMQSAQTERAAPRTNGQRSRSRHGKRKYFRQSAIEPQFHGRRYGFARPWRAARPGGELSRKRPIRRSSRSRIRRGVVPAA